MPTWNNWPKLRSTTNKTLKESDLVWLIQDSDSRQYYNLGRFTETIDGSDRVIRLVIFQTNDGVMKRPVVKLVTVLPGREFFAMENRASNMVAECTNSTTKLNSASRPFRAVKLEKHD